MMTMNQNQVLDDKQCPFCAETIKAAATVCRFCNRDLTASSVDDGWGGGWSRMHSAGLGAIFGFGIGFVLMLRGCGKIGEILGGIQLVTYSIVGAIFAIIGAIIGAAAASGESRKS